MCHVVWPRGETFRSLSLEHLRQCSGIYPLSDLPEQITIFRTREHHNTDFISTGKNNTLNALYLSNFDRGLKFYLICNKSSATGLEDKRCYTSGVINEAQIA